jgi:hypothetical protein
MHTSAHDAAVITTSRLAAAGVDTAGIAAPATADAVAGGVELLRVTP